MVKLISPLARARAFCDAFELRLPILMAPMAGACPASLAIAVANAGGLGGCGALLMKPEAIRAWSAEVRAQTNGAFQINLWIPDPAPRRDPAHEARVREFLGEWGPPVEPEAGNVAPIDFAEQCEAMLDVGPAIVSSIMGVYPPKIVERMKEKGIRWLANVTTVAEAHEAAAAGADVIVAQGMEAGRHLDAAGTVRMAAPVLTEHAIASAAESRPTTRDAGDQRLLGQRCPPRPCPPYGPLGGLPAIIGCRCAQMAPVARRTDPRLTPENAGGLFVIPFSPTVRVGQFGEHHCARASGCRLIHW